MLEPKNEIRWVKVCDDVGSDPGNCSCRYGVGEGAYEPPSPPVWGFPEEGISPLLSPLVAGGAVTDIPCTGQGGNRGPSAQGSLQEQLPPLQHQERNCWTPHPCKCPLEWPLNSTDPSSKSRPFWLYLVESCFQGPHRWRTGLSPTRDKTRYSPSLVGGDDWDLEAGVCRIPGE